MTELLACPHCQSRALAVGMENLKDIDHSGDGPYVVMCTGCNSCSPSIEVWNKRIFIKNINGVSGND